MLYYIIIGQTKDENANEKKGIHGDALTLVARDDVYSRAPRAKVHPSVEGAHCLFGYLDVNFNESVQYGTRASATQEAWLIGRHRIGRTVDFGNLGYQFVRQSNTKRIQFPDTIILSFDRQIKDNGLARPSNDLRRVDIELTQLDQQILNCYDKPCVIEPIIFKLSKFDNYGDAYLDLVSPDHENMFYANIDHFVSFMKHYPNTNIYIMANNPATSYNRYSISSSSEQKIKLFLNNLIKKEHLTNYFEFCNARFARRSIDGRKQSGQANSEYDTFESTIDEFFNQRAFNENPGNMHQFYHLPFKRAKIVMTVGAPWARYERSQNFILFLQHNPQVTLDIVGSIQPEEVARFIHNHGIKANVVLENDPHNTSIKTEIAQNRARDLQNIITHYRYDTLEDSPVVEAENRDYRLSLAKYAPQLLRLSSQQNESFEDMHVGQNQNQNQNQNQSQQFRQNENELFEPIKYEFNDKSSIPDVQFETNDSLLKSIIGLDFRHSNNTPQTETNINHIFLIMGMIIGQSPASQNCYCPLSYSVEELVPGAFYVPQDKVQYIPHPTASAYNFNPRRNTLFFSPPYASIAIKKDKYAFKPYLRPRDDFPTESSRLISEILRDTYLANLIVVYQDDDAQREKIFGLLNKLYYKLGQPGVDLLSKALYALHLKNPAVHQIMLQYYLLSSEDLSEYLEARCISTFEALSTLTDPKKLEWWRALVAIQCRNNPKFDLNNLWDQFTSFWADLDKIQKFIPIPDQFPFADFADAGLCLGKMIRILYKARNRFEQIQRFEGGNISHAYMLSDLFNTSMYCPEMDAYCATLMQELKAEDAFDKEQLKARFFSTQKLLELTLDPSVNLEEMKSYYYIFAAVNGHTATHNNSDQAFYAALFQIIEQAISERSLSDAEKKWIYSTFILFTAYGNNTTMERMEQDVKALLLNENFMEICQFTLDLWANNQVSEFFSQSDARRTMLHSEAMPSLHTVSKLIQTSQNYREIMQQSLLVVIVNHHPTVSLALQKIMREAPRRIMEFGQQPVSIPKTQESDKTHFIQSIALIATLSNQKITQQQFDTTLQQIATRLTPLSALTLSHSHRLFLDIDWNSSSQNTLFQETNLSRSFVERIRRIEDLDNLIFVFQDYQVTLATMRPSEESLVLRIQYLQQSLHNNVHKQNYVMNCKHLIEIKLQNKLKETVDISGFLQDVIQPLDTSTGTSQELVTIFTALRQIIDTAKSSDLQQILPILQSFQSNTDHGYNPAQLLKVTALLLQHIYPIERVLTFLEQMKSERVAGNRQAKLAYVAQVFDKINQDPACLEEGQLPKKVTQQLKSSLIVIAAMRWSISNQTTWERSFQTNSLHVLQYLRWLEVLHSPTNFHNPNVINHVFKLDQILFNVYARLPRTPKAFDDILSIITFDATLLTVVEQHFNQIEVIARICKNEVLLNAQQHDPLAEDYQQIFANNMQYVLAQPYDVLPFYSEEQLAHPDLNTLVTLLQRYRGNVSKALHHFEKDPWDQRPHRMSHAAKESFYQAGSFDMSKQYEVIGYITSQYSEIEQSIRRNLLLSFATYINEKGYRLPALAHQSLAAWVTTQVPARKLSDKELKRELINIQSSLARLRIASQNNIWQHRKYQRTVCNVLVILREAVYRYDRITAYSTQMDAILLAIFAGDYSYAMQINTGEGKAIIATIIAISVQIITGKQLVITTSNLSLALRDGDSSHRLFRWLGISHATISASLKDKSQLNAQVIHTTGHDFALFHGKDHTIKNNNRIYLDDECDYTMSLLTPSINSQSTLNEEENWWIYETILDYVKTMSSDEAKRKPEQQANDLIQRLITQYTIDIQTIERECTLKLNEVRQNKQGLSPEAQAAARDRIEKDCYARKDVYAKRIQTLELPRTRVRFNALINSAIIAQFVLTRGESYEAVDHLEDGKISKKVVPTENGKPVTEGNMMYMYGIHQFLVEKEIKLHEISEGTDDFIKPPELESTTYFNNYATHAGCKSIGMTGTVPRNQYRMHDALLRNGRSIIIPPHKTSLRKDAVPFDSFDRVKIGSPHVCANEEIYIQRTVQKILEHDGPVLIYCRYKNICEQRRDALEQQLTNSGYTVQMIIAGVTEDFTDGDKLTESGRKAENPRTVTLTVGDGRGIDTKAKGSHGQLTMVSFLPETPEKVLQIYGRSGRNGKKGKTDLLILESDLTLYGISFENMAKAFQFIDEIRSKEFDFAIQKIGFLQYEIQKQIPDETKRIALIAFMDNLYNQLLLEAVATKIREERSNQILEYTIIGRWEPFVMLSDRDLENIYQQFCISTQTKIREEQLHTIQLYKITDLRAGYDASMREAIIEEQASQYRIDRDYIRNRIQVHASKQQRMAVGDTVIFEGNTIELPSPASRQTYGHVLVNLGRCDKILSLIQKYLCSHLGIYGQEGKNNPAYNEIYQLFLRNEQRIIAFRQAESRRFYQYLAYAAFLKTITLCQQELSSNRLRPGSLRSRVQPCFREARGYARLAGIDPNVLKSINLPKLFDTLDLNTSTGNVSSYLDNLRNDQYNLNQKLQEVARGIQTREEAITTECLREWDNLSTILQRNLPRVFAAIPVSRLSAESIHLFAMLQLTTHNERNTLPIRLALTKLPIFSDPNIRTYNARVAEYQQILYNQRKCLVSLDRSPDLSQKLNRYRPLIEATDLSSKNLLSFFYSDRTNLENRIAELAVTIRQEAQQLQRLQEEERCSNEQERRALYIRQVRQQIENVHQELREEINELEHPSNKASRALQQLFTDLNAEKNKYLSTLDSLLTTHLDLKQNYRGEPLNRVNQAYILACRQLIHNPTMRSILAQDLKWGPYLSNWLRKLANILIMVVTFGYVKSYFTLAVPRTITVLDTKEGSLHPLQP